MPKIDLPLGLQDEYPSDEDLNELENFEGSAKEMIEYAASIYSDYGWIHVSDGYSKVIRQKVKRIEMVTGGWSGNEDVIGVLQETLLWGLYWRKSERGGYYMFEIPEKDYDVKPPVSLGSLKKKWYNHMRYSLTQRI